MPGKFFSADFDSMEDALTGLSNALSEIRTALELEGPSTFEGLSAEPDLYDLEEEFFPTAYDLVEDPSTHEINCFSNVEGVPIEIGVCFGRNSVVDGVVTPSTTFGSPTSAVPTINRAAEEAYIGVIHSEVATANIELAAIESDVNAMAVAFGRALDYLQKVESEWGLRRKWKARGKGKTARKVGANQDTKLQKFFGNNDEEFSAGLSDLRDFIKDIAATRLQLGRPSAAAVNGNALGMQNFTVECEMTDFRVYKQDVTGDLRVAKTAPAADWHSSVPLWILHTVGGDYNKSGSIAESLLADGRALYQQYVDDKEQEFETLAEEVNGADALKVWFVRQVEEAQVKFNALWDLKNQWRKWKFSAGNHPSVDD